MKKNRRIWVTGVLGLILIIILGIGGYRYYLANTQSVNSSPMQTSKARSGDIRITVDGYGYLLPEQQVELGFLTGGVVVDVDAAVGKEVNRGDTLAQMDDGSRRLELAMKELALQALLSPEALNTAEIAQLNAEDSLDTALTTLQFLISRTVYNSQVALDAANDDLFLKQANNASQEDISAASLAVENARQSLISAQYYYKTEYAVDVLDYTPSEQDINLAWAQVRTSELAVKDTELYIQRLSSDDPCADSNTIGSFTTTLNQACLDVDLAQLALDGSRLVAPIDGLITECGLSVGQVTTTAPAVSIASKQMYVQLYIEETDLDGIQVGLPVNIRFDAYPDDTFTGVIEQVDPQMVTIDSTPAVSIRAAINTTGTEKMLLAGLTAQVEVIKGEAMGTVLIPIQALRELAPGSYAVFVVQPDSSLVLTPVQIGLEDRANVQVISGLTVGDVVSTGIVETK